MDENKPPHWSQQIEPGAGSANTRHIEATAAVSQAISLKRIADALEGMNHLPDRLADAIFMAIDNASANHQRRS